MSRPPHCPSPVEMREFLLGKAGTWDVETIEAHLTVCPECQSRMGQIEADDEIVFALRGGDASPVAHNSSASGTADSNVGKASPEGTALLAQHLLPGLKRIPDRLDQTVTGNSSVETPAEQDSQASSETILENSPVGSFAAGSLPTDRLGRYELTAVLGWGGMGAVYRAWDPLLERPVAIKVPRTELLANRKIRERMLQEARAAAAVVDDHIVPIHAVEESGGTPFIVMPLLQGESLKQAMDRSKQPVPVDEVLRIGREAAAGLAAAHRQGLLHCDLKPGNLWLEAPSRRVKLLDFGLAVPFEPEGAQPVGGSGTPGYLAPEQVQHAPLDPRTDVFGLGCVLFQLAAGRLPFIGPAAMRVFWTVMAETPPPLNTLRPELPKRLSDLIGRMLDRDPSGRPADGAAVLEELLTIDGELHAVAASRLRRRHWMRIAGATLVSGGGMAAWAAWFGPRGPEDVLLKFTVADSSVGVILVRDGHEQRVPPGGPTTVALAPGIYELRPDESRSRWSVVPDRLVVEPVPRHRAVTLSPYGELARQAAHTRSGTGVLFRRDETGSFAISVGLDRRLVRWPVDKAASSGVQAADLPHEGRCLALSADQMQVYTAGGNRQSPTALELCRRDVRTLEEAGRLEGADRMTQSMDCSANGRWVAAAIGEGVRVWDSREVDSGQALEAGFSVHSVRWSAAGERLVAAGESGRYALWTQLGDRFQLSHVGRCGRGTLRSVLWRNKTLLMAGTDGTVWQVRLNITETKSVATVTGTEGIATENVVTEKLATVAGAIQSLALSDDGRWLLTGDDSGTIGLWATADWSRRGVLLGHRGAVTSVAIEPGSRRAVSTGQDGMVLLWQLPALPQDAASKV